MFAIIYFCQTSKIFLCDFNVNLCLCSANGTKDKMSRRHSTNSAKLLTDMKEMRIVDDLVSSLLYTNGFHFI